MEGARWTDERIDERMAAMEEKFDRLFDELHDVRGEMSGLRGDFSALQRHVILILAAQAVGLVGLLGVLVAAQL